MYIYLYLPNTVEAHQAGVGVPGSRGGLGRGGGELGASPEPGEEIPMGAHPPGIILMGGSARGSDRGARDGGGLPRLHC